MATRTRRIIHTLFPTPVGMNRGWKRLTSRARLFPTPVGMNRIMVHPRLTLTTIPHACGDEPPDLSRRRST